MPPDLTIRREKLPKGRGYRLNFTGPEATHGLMELIMTKIEEKWMA